MAYTAEWLSTQLSLPLVGDQERLLRTVKPVANATEDSLTFITSKRYLKQLPTPHNYTIITKPDYADGFAGTVILADDPYLAYAKAVSLLYPRPEVVPGIHPTAVIDDRADISPLAEIGPQVVIEAGSRIAAGVVLGAGCYIGADVCIGEDTCLLPRVTVYHGCTIGVSCRIQSGVVIGSDGFGYAKSGLGWQAIHQLGCVRIGDRVEIGANTTIDRGALEDTVIDDDVILDNLIQVAHNVTIGQGTAMAGCVGIAGSAHIGAQCTVGGASTILGHLDIVDGVHVTATSLVSQGISEPGVYSSGGMLEENRSWRRNAARFKQLDGLHKRVKKLESSR